MNSVKVKGMLATIVAAILMGSLGFFVRQAGIDAGLTAFFRFLVGFFIISAIVIFNISVKKKKLKTSLSSFFSGIAISLCILFYFFAIKTISIGLAAFTLYLGPVFAIIGEAVINRKLPSKLQFLIIFMAFGGFFLISSLDSISFSEINTGLILALLSGVFYGGYILINRVIPQEINLNTRIFWQFLAAVITIGSTLLFRDVSFDGFATGWPYVLTIGLVQGFFVLLLTGYAIKNLSSIEFGALSYIEPLVAVLLGFYLYNENLSSIQLVGVGLIVLATLIQCLSIKKD